MCIRDSVYAVPFQEQPRVWIIICRIGKLYLRDPLFIPAPVSYTHLDVYKRQHIIFCKAVYILHAHIIVGPEQRESVPAQLVLCLLYTSRCV